MIYAPVIIPTLNRYEHFKECIESLQRNTVAKETEIYIGLDYPPSSKYTAGYKKIKEYLNKGIEGFLRVNVFERDTNLGPRRNGLDLRQRAYSKYDVVIATEDDNVFAPSCLEFMNDALYRYKNNSNFIGVSGYSYPVNWVDDSNNVVICDTFAPLWGWGVWKDTYYRLKQTINLEYFRTALRNKELVESLRVKSPHGYYKFMEESFKDVVVFQDVSLSIYMALSGNFMIIPKFTKVKNNGHDGSGVHCRKIENSILKTQKLDLSHYAGIHDTSIFEVLDQNRKIVNNFFLFDKLLHGVPLLRRAECSIAYTLIRIFSVDRFFYLYDKYQLRTKYRNLKQGVKWLLSPFRKGREGIS